MMKSERTFRAVSVALIASTAILLSGCGITSATSSQQTAQQVAQTGKTVALNSVKNKQPEPSSPHSSVNVGYNIHKPSMGVNIGGLYGIIGVIKHINKTPSVLNSITLSVIKPLTGPDGFVNTRRGQSIVIHFNESWSLQGQLNPQVGGIISVGYGQFVTNKIFREKKLQTTGVSFWGSNFSWCAFERGGKWYRSTGKQAFFANESGHKVSYPS